MSPEDKQFFTDKFNHLEGKVDTQSAITAKIERGMYGDKENKVPGLIDLPKRVQSLEDTRKKVYWIGGGLIALLETGWHGIKEFFAGH